MAFRALAVSTKSGISAAALVVVLILGALVAVMSRAEAGAGIAVSDWSALRFTVWQAFLSAILSVVLAVPLARALARRRFAGRAILVTLLGAPFILPVIVAVLGLLTIFGRSGWLNAVLTQLGLPPVSIYGLHGVVLAHVFFNLPLATRLILQGWQEIPAERFRLAAQLNAGPGAIWQLLEAPMLRRVVPGALAVVFAICCIGGSFGGGNMFQVNQALEQVVSVTGGEESFLANNGWVFGVVVAALVGVTIIGGIKSIGKVTSRLVPFMGVLYVVAGLVVILMNIEHVPAAFGAIFDGAFSTQSAFGGLVGVLIVGFQRAAFSNEAGIGSASIAHSAVKTDHPVTEGLVALYEPFIDTVIVCTITALVIGIAGFIPEAPTSGQGIALTSAAFGSAISWFPYVLTVAAVLFAFSTMLAWSYYGLRAFNYLFGHGKAVDMTYNILFLAFIVIGSSMSLTAVIGFSDAMIFAMSIPNLIGLYFLAPVVKRELAKYMAKIKSGEVKQIS